MNKLNAFILLTFSCFGLSNLLVIISQIAQFQKLSMQDYFGVVIFFNILIEIVALMLVGLIALIRNDLKKGKI